MAAPYHLFAMMAPYKDVGIAFESILSVTPLGPGGFGIGNVFNFGVQADSDYQKVDATTVLTYPCQGVTGVDYQMRGEDPNPVPGRDMYSNPVGHPIYVMVRKGQTLVITSASMVNAMTGAAVKLLPPVTAANDPNNHLQGYGKYMGFVLPDLPLAINTQYQATVTGTNDGAAFSRTFTFTTGSNYN